MATTFKNILAPFGFRPARNVGGLGHRITEMPLAIGWAETLAIGDLVKTINGNVQKAHPGDAFMGIFQGVQYVMPNGKIVWSKTWAAGTPTQVNQPIVVNLSTDPNETYKAQSSQLLNPADVGKFVDLVDAAPNMAYGVSLQSVGATIPYMQLASIALGVGGTGITVAPTIVITPAAGDVLVGGASAVFIVNGAGVATGIQMTSFGQYTLPPVITLVGGTFTTTPTAGAVTLSAAITPSQFYIERLLAEPMRVTDPVYNTAGYGLSLPGQFSLAELKPVKHQRGGLQMAVSQ